MTQCWHCNSSSGTPRRCPCVICDGSPCAVCIGRAKTEKIHELADRLLIDVRDTRNYELITEGPHRYRKLKLPVGVAA